MNMLTAMLISLVTTSPAPVATPSDGAVLALSVTFDGGCNTECLEGDGFLFCPVGQHVAEFSLHGFTDGASHTGCRDGECGGNGEHQYCAGDGDFEDSDVEELRLAVLLGDLRTVQAYARSAPNSVYINFDRAAVQVLNCQGEVVAHLPLETAAVRPLAADS